MTSKVGVIGFRDLKVQNLNIWFSVFSETLRFFCYFYQSVILYPRLEQCVSK